LIVDDQNETSYAVLDVVKRNSKGLAIVSDSSSESNSSEGISDDEKRVHNSVSRIMMQ